MHPRVIPLDHLAALSIVPADDARPVSAPPPRFTSADALLLAVVISALGTLTVLGLALGQAGRLRRALCRGESDDKRLNEIARSAASRMGLAVPPALCVVSARVSALRLLRAAGVLALSPP